MEQPGRRSAGAGLGPSSFLYLAQVALTDRPGLCNSVPCTMSPCSRCSTRDTACLIERHLATARRPGTSIALHDRIAPELNNDINFQNASDLIFGKVTQMEYSLRINNVGYSIFSMLHACLLVMALQELSMNFVKISIYTNRSWL